MSLKPDFDAVVKRIMEENASLRWQLYVAEDLNKQMREGAYEDIETTVEESTQVADDGEV